jgi:hypothetical protein
MTVITAQELLSCRHANFECNVSRHRRRICLAAYAIGAEELSH